MPPYSYIYSWWYVIRIEFNLNNAKNPNDVSIWEFPANLTLRLSLASCQLLQALHFPFYPNSSIFHIFSPPGHFRFFDPGFFAFLSDFSIGPFPAAFFEAAFFMWRVWLGCSICVVNYEKAKSHSSLLLLLLFLFLLFSSSSPSQK